MLHPQMVRAVPSFVHLRPANAHAPEQPVRTIALCTCAQQTHTLRSSLRAQLPCTPAPSKRTRPGAACAHNCLVHLRPANAHALEQLVRTSALCTCAQKCPQFSQWEEAGRSARKARSTPPPSSHAGEGVLRGLL